MSDESFQLTNQLRYLSRADQVPVDDPTAPEGAFWTHHVTVLQQMWQGSNGTQRWVDVPTVEEEETDQASQS